MGYPIHFGVEYQERYSRLSTFFRLILVIPHIFALFFYGIVAYVCIFLSWFAILFTGRYPRGMFMLVAGFLSYSTRVNGYYYLLTDKFPPFGGGAPGDGYPVQLSVDFPDRLSRLTTFFRSLMAIPAEIVLYFLGLLGAVLAFFAWIVVIILGRLPRGLFERHGAAAAVSGARQRLPVPADRRVPVVPGRDPRGSRAVGGPRSLTSN